MRSVVTDGKKICRTERMNRDIASRLSEASGYAALTRPTSLSGAPGAGWNEFLSIEGHRF